MPAFNTTLLREKFIIRDEGEDGKETLTAVSNRIVMPMASKNGALQETLVIRAYNMHTCVRLAARVEQDFQENGPILHRPERFPWGEIWQSLIHDYEAIYNQALWVAVYHQGKIVFEDGRVRRHDFLDIIEQCDIRNLDNYENAIKVAENAFLKAGKKVSIEHNSNIALVLTHTEAESRCGIIIRGPSRSMTFNFVARPSDGRAIRVSQSLNAAATFLEGIQLAFQSGVIKQKLLYNMIDPASSEAVQGREAARKIGRLDASIEQFEKLAQVTYRPERPDFKKIADDAQAFARLSLFEGYDDSL